MSLAALMIVLAVSIPHVACINLGNDSLVNEPFMVALFLHRPYTRESVHCSGTLISQDYVLTAARCFYDNDVSTINIIFGALATDRWEEGHLTVTQNTSGLTLHPGFDPDTFANNLALIKLDDSIPFTDFISPVALYDGDETLEGENSTILGYGLYDYQLKYAFNPILSTVDCQTSDVFYEDLVTDEHICFAGYGFLSACEGDFGGPLLVDDVQVGVLSFYWHDEYNYCYFDQPTVSTRISRFRSWIRDISGV
ncbi:trypsin delta-like [Cylas formicarius]|uniref:trypsin delta-like n=1 Tax=Cylas formicarius TaxID=197179 RepID=UPI0029586A16|nr:trypsin delta-like [Cylas formicarius]